MLDSLKLQWICGINYGLRVYLVVLIAWWIFFQLRERGVFNTGEQTEEGGMGVLLRLIDLPATDNLTQHTITTLRRHLLSATIRMQVAVAWVSFSVCSCHYYSMSYTITTVYYTVLIFSFYIVDTQLHDLNISCTTFPSLQEVKTPELWIKNCNQK